MRYDDLCAPTSIELKGIGDEPSKEVFEAQRQNPVHVASHHGCIRDEHDRFLPKWFNGINMPINVRD